jgi:hypothetical protein
MVSELGIPIFNIHPQVISVTQWTVFLVYDQSSNVAFVRGKQDTIFTFFSLFSKNKLCAGTYFLWLAVFLWEAKSKLSSNDSNVCVAVMILLSHQSHWVSKRIQDPLFRALDNLHKLIMKGFSEVDFLLCSQLAFNVQFYSGLVKDLQDDLGLKNAKDSIHPPPFE